MNFTDVWSTAANLNCQKLVGIQKSISVLLVAPPQRAKRLIYSLWCLWVCVVGANDNKELGL